MPNDAVSVHVTDPVPPEPGAATVQPVGHVIALNVVFGGVCWYKTALFTAFGPLFVMVSVYVMVPEGETTEVEAVWVKARSACAATGAGASNVIPATATASIDMRLVKGIDHEMAEQRVIEHIRKQGYFIVDTEPDAKTRMSHPKLALVKVESGGYNASRTSMDLPISQLVLKTAESARGPVVKLPTMGGSVPLYMIDEILHVPTITVPIANHANNQHSFNENIRIQNLWDGIELMAALLAM